MGLRPCQWMNTSRHEMARSLSESMLCTMLTMLCSILASRNMVLAVKVLYSPCSCHSSASFNQACHSMHHQLCHHDPAPYMLCTSCLQTCGSKHFKSFPLYFYRIICKGLVKQNVLLSEPWSLPMQPWPPGQILRGRCTAGLIGRVSFLQAMAPKKICGM